MEDPFSPSSPAAVPNVSSVPEPAGGLNLSAPGGQWPLPSRRARAASAGAVLLLALVGNCLVLRRLGCCGCCGRGRRRRRKMDFLIAHLALADLCGCGLALLPRLAAELRGPGWPPGAAACRLLPLLQGCGPLASAHVLVLLALERHHVVRRPARPPLPARGLAALGWLLAPLLALPQAFVFRPAPRPGGPRCRSIFEELPRWHGLAYAAYGAATGFVAPACLLGWAYGRILLAVWAARGHKAAAGSGRRYAGPPPGLGGCGMPRARARTLQLTLVLIALFALCRLPRCAMELGLASAPARPGARGAREALAALGIVAAANSALNPFAYLLFQSHRPWARRLQRGLCGAGPGGACCCPGLEAEPRRRATHRAPHRPRRRPPADAAPADPSAAISGPPDPGAATADAAISGPATPGAATAGAAISGPATPGAAISEPATAAAAVSGPATPPPGAAAESRC
ncbi:probable G-protein coupled receptor 150 [Dromaius novaehollandiae]|uniref:probable G-protein coupled receptor 150 n=1 Tax=Dromaius novaehollandiae TaxID=8790 RepID=UPI00311F1EAC